MACGHRLLNSVHQSIVSACRCLHIGSSGKSVVVNDDEAFYEEVLEQEINSIEHEPYFRPVDRRRAEDILRDRVDGSCLVRHFKEHHESIKYIVSVYVNGHFFHLFVRRTSTHQYTFGQPKTDEKLFNHPSHIIRFYRLHKLTCTNRETSVRIVLVPIN